MNLVLLITALVILLCVWLNILSGKHRTYADSYFFPFGTPCISFKASSDSSDCLNLAVFITLIARPFTVSLLLLPFKAGLNQIFLISWAGFRGALSIVFAITATLNTVSEYDIFHSVFFIYSAALHFSTGKPAFVCSQKVEYDRWQYGKLKHWQYGFTMKCFLIVFGMLWVGHKCLNV